MDWVQVHLAVSHVPVIGIPFLVLLLSWSWWSGNAHLTRLVLWWLIVLCLISVALKFTGDFAAEQTGAKLDYDLGWVERHKQSADQAATAVFLLGIAAGAGVFAGWRKGSTPKWAVGLAWVLGLLTCLLLARAAHLGGQITHLELRSRQSRFQSLRM